MLGHALCLLVRAPWSVSQHVAELEGERIIKNASHREEGEHTQEDEVLGVICKTSASLLWPINGAVGTSCLRIMPKKRAGANIDHRMGISVIVLMPSGSNWQPLHVSLSSVSPSQEQQPAFPLKNISHMPPHTKVYIFRLDSSMFKLFFAVAYDMNQIIGAVKT